MATGPWPTAAVRRPFCRLLRACLGEPGFATDAQRSRIFARLPNGLIAAEILVDGVCWVAVRPLGLPGGEFVTQVASVEEAIARGRREGDPAFIDPLMVETFFPMIAGATPSDINREQVWDVLRAWSRAIRSAALPTFWRGGRRKLTLVPVLKCSAKQQS